MALHGTVLSGACTDERKGCHCKASTLPEKPDMAKMHSMMESMSGHQKAFMEGMMAMHDPMMQGVMAADPDIAFLCGMIPHHQGAINMAKVELEQGDSAEAKEMAQKIIDAQVEEIAEMTKMIEAEASK